MKKLISLMALVFLVTACGPDRALNRARKQEKKGNYYKAWKLYQDFAANNPKHAGAAEAVFRAGWLSERRLSDCHVASTFYQTVTARYPQSDPWARLAAHQQANCPDYFPLVSGHLWVEADSESGGQAARIETTVESVDGDVPGFPSYQGWLVRSFYAGDSKFKTTRILYKKTPEEIQEYLTEADPVPRVVLRWPLQEGTRWNTRVGGYLGKFEIVSMSKKIQVKAGEFDNCLHVRWTLPGVPGATNEYYAPGVGKILTSYSTGDVEKRKTELISYRSADFAEPAEEK